MMADDERIVRRGVRDGYHWLTCTGDAYMGTLLHVCPELVLRRYLAVTSRDSGVRRLTGEWQDSGWQSRGDIAYSPLIEAIEGLDYQRDGLECPGYDEWYVFDAPRDLGRMFHGSLFDLKTSPGELMVFVNHPAFVLHDPPAYIPGYLDLFWKQMAWIQPESYVADGKDCVTLVSRNQALIDAAGERLVRL